MLLENAKPIGVRRRRLQVKVVLDYIRIAGRPVSVVPQTGCCHADVIPVPVRFSRFPYVAVIREGLAIAPNESGAALGGGGNLPLGRRGPTAGIALFRSAVSGIVRQTDPT